MECGSFDDGGGRGATVPSLITTQMVQGPVFFLTGVRTHVGGGGLWEGRDLELAAGGLCSGSFVWFEQEGQKSEASSHPFKICFPLLTA